MKEFEEWMAELGWEAPSLAAKQLGSASYVKRSGRGYSVLTVDEAETMYAAACQAYEAGEKKGWGTGYHTGYQAGITALLQAVVWPNYPQVKRLLTRDNLVQANQYQVLVSCKAALTAAAEKVTGSRHE